MTVLVNFLLKLLYMNVQFENMYYKQILNVGSTGRVKKFKHV